ncbi:MAG TPA: hypothetical protein DIS90_05420 [Cytophagales bacterium]|nr:hypothetical protein [Cytophagales bacterium]HCR52940.1 hypothetical protein [Cytophagales bacterium]
MNDLHSSIKLIVAGGLLLTVQLLYAQENLEEKPEKRLEMSVDVFSGASSIVTGVGFKKNGAIGSSQYHYTPTFGFGGDLGYSLLPRLSVHASVGYLQRGAEFTMLNTTEKRTFQLYYVDAWGYFEYATLDKVKFTFLSGLTQSTLIAARLTALGGNSSVMGDFKRMDFGFIAGPGVFLPVHKHKIRIRALFSYGFRDVFAENHFNDNIKAHNHAYLFQVGYIW